MAAAAIAVCRHNATVQIVDGQKVVNDLDGQSACASTSFTQGQRLIWQFHQFSGACFSPYFQDWSYSPVKLTPPPPLLSHQSPVQPNNVWNKYIERLTFIHPKRNLTVLMSMSRVPPNMPNSWNLIRSLLSLEIIPSTRGSTRALYFLLLLSSPILHHSNHAEFIAGRMFVLLNQLQCQLCWPHFLKVFFLVQLAVNTSYLAHGSTGWGLGSML